MSALDHARAIDINAGEDHFLPNHGVPSKPLERGIASDAASFLRGAAYSMVQAPADGIQQLLSHTKVGVEPLHIVDAPSDADKFGQAGRVAGSILEFCLVNAAVGKLTGIGKLAATSTASMEALKMGLTGAVMAASTPVRESDHFGLRKTAAIIEAVGSYSTFGAINGKASSLTILGRAGFRSFVNDGLIYGLSGTASGLVGAEIHTGLTQGRGANLRELGAGAGQNMLLGFALASIDHVMPGRSIKIEPATDGVATSTLSTEDWISKHYDGKVEISSPILTLLAEKKPGLRPPHYSDLRARVFAEENPRDFSLGDWAPEQRLSVIKELRRMSNRKLWTDANIDAFISRFTTPKLVSLVSEFDRTSRPIDQALRKVKDEVAKHPELAKTSPAEIKYDKRTREAIRNAGNGNLIDLVDDLKTLESKDFDRPERKSMNEDLQSKLNGITAEIGLPTAKIVGYQGETGLYISGHLEVGMGMRPAMSAETLDRTIHEFNHHVQGPLYGHDTLIHMAKLPVYAGLKQLGFIDEIPQKQAVDTTEEYYEKYVGSTNEVESFATGLLGRIRAMAAGLPLEDNAT